MKNNYYLASRNYNLGTETAFTVLAKANKLASEGHNIINLFDCINDSCYCDWSVVPVGSI